MLNTQEQLALLKGSDENRPLTIMTGLRYNAGLAKLLNNMTFLYDPNWEYESGNPTYPLAFFYVKNMNESMESEISQKPLLFYNSSGNETSQSAGLMNIVSDNVLAKPKTYKVDVLIPANADFFSETLLNRQQIANVWQFIASNEKLLRSTDNSVMLNVDSILSVLEALFKGLYGTSLGVSALMNTMLQQQDYNKASIEYMWRNRRIIKFKIWNGWSFKYLVIKSFDVTKVGENENYYEGSLTCQEVPIMTFKNQVKTSLGITSKISSVLGKSQKAVAEGFIKAMSTTLGE